MNIYKRLFTAFLLLASASAAFAADVSLKNMRLWHEPGRTRVVLDLTGPVEYKLGIHGNPDRLSVDIGNTNFRAVLPSIKTIGPFIRNIRFHEHENFLRVVFDLNQRIAPSAQTLAPDQGYGHRLVIDMLSGNKAQPPSTPNVTQPTPPQPPKPVKRDFVVVVDPGHGGKDPGAIGKRRTREKDVVLAISKKLHDRINATPGMRAVMTRKGDYYISLRKRIGIAREHNADLFVSVHADAVAKRAARGSSVYALSQRGATSETARLLADKENASDLVGGVTISDKDPVLAGVLIDLSVTKTISESLIFGRDVLQQLKRIGPVHSQRVEQAAFVVLKSPDIPSILVETAYISNLQEEKLLRSSGHQNKIADSILAGIRSYLKRRPSQQAYAQ